MSGRRKIIDPGYTVGMEPTEEAGAICNTCHGKVDFTTNWLGDLIERCGACRKTVPVPIQMPVGFTRCASRISLDEEIAASVKVACSPANPQQSRISQMRRSKGMRFGKFDPQNEDAA